MEEALINASIAIAALLVLIIPLYVLNKKSSKEKKMNLLKQFDQYCVKHALHIDDMEVIGNKVFGYDSVKNILILVFIMGDVEEEYLIHLNESINASAGKVISKNGNSEVMLAYSLRTGQKNEILFYRHFRDNEDDLMPLLIKAESISGLINQVNI
jgi:hypothetical protein